jgi:hypothetical protein
MEQNYDAEFEKAFSSRLELERAAMEVAINVVAALLLFLLLCLCLSLSLSNGVSK